MARLPSFRRIAADFIAKDYPDLADTLISPLNNFMETVTRALNKGITIGDNVDGVIATFSTDGTYPVKIRWDRSQKPAAVWIGQIARVDGAAVGLASAVSIDWSFNQAGQIEIADVVGLSASGTDQYFVTIIGVVG
jgi:hypothetical protein